MMVLLPLQQLSLHFRRFRDCDSTTPRRGRGWRRIAVPEAQQGARGGVPSHVSRVGGDMSHCPRYPRVTARVLPLAHPVALWMSRFAAIRARGAASSNRLIQSAWELRLLRSEGGAR